MNTSPKFCAFITVQAIPTPNSLD